MSKRLFFLTLLGLAGMGSLWSQVSPRLVVGSQGGYGSAGGHFYAFHLGEACIGTVINGGQMATIGFLQPEIPSVLAQAPQLTLRGRWTPDGRQLSGLLSSPELPLEYQLWRGPTARPLALLAALPGQHREVQWMDAQSSLGQQDWYYQLRALLPDGRTVFSQVLHLQAAVGLQMGWQAYPNPARETLHLILWGDPALEAGTIELCNAMGQVIGTHSVSADLHRQALHLPVADRPVGLYLLRWRSATFTQQRWVQLGQ